MSGRGRQVATSSATTLTLIGAALAQAQGTAHAAAPPLAECHDMTMTFENVSYRSYDVVVTAVVTRPGIFHLGDGHAYFGTSETVPNPAGERMTSTATIISPEPGSTVEWGAGCVGGSVSATVHVPAAPVPPRLVVRGPLTVRATGHHGAPDPLRATAVDNHGRPLSAHCTPAVLPLTPSRTKVTCTSARDASGRVGVATRVVTVLGAGPQLAQLRDSLGPSRLRDLISSAHDAVVRRDGPTAARRLGLVLDELPTSGLRGQRVLDVRADIERIGHVLGRKIPHLHTVRPGETIWSVVTDALSHKGLATDDHSVALGVRLVLARNPGVLDKWGFLHPGTVLSLPL